MAFMRKSKFRHVFGKPLRKDQCYDCLRISRSSWDSTFSAVNPKYVAVITESGGGGSFIIMPLSKVGRVDVDSYQIAGHKNTVLDIAWCPHNDDVIASASEDCTVKIWQIPEGGLKETMTEPVVVLIGHQRRVTAVLWHPSALNVLLTTGSDNKLFMWNVGTGELILDINTPDQISCISFNEDGSQFACTCKDKKMRVMDSHTGVVLKEVQSHDGTKPQQCAFMKDGLVVTSGFSRMSERQYALWDTKPSTVKNLTKEEIDSSNGVLFIFADHDTGMFYLVGKGDSLIRYYEVTNDAPYIHYLDMYHSSAPQRGIGYMPKRGLQVNSNEIARFYKLHNSGLCEVIPFTVPRKSELFQDDLYPDTASDNAAMSADVFLSGKNAKPVLMSLKDGSTSTKKEQLTVVRKSNVLDKMSAKVALSNSNGAEAAAAPAFPPAKAQQEKEEAVDALMKEVEELKKMVQQQDTRIETLEKKMAQLEAAHNTDEEDNADDADCADDACADDA